MNTDQRTTYVTRDMILKTLSDAEVASVSTAETGESLTPGDEYVDLGAPQDGVQKAGPKPRTPMGRVLPKKSIQASTWNKIVATLKVPGGGAKS